VHSWDAHAQAAGAARGRPRRAFPHRRATARCRRPAAHSTRHGHPAACAYTRIHVRTAHPTRGAPVCAADRLTFTSECPQQARLIAYGCVWHTTSTPLETPWLHLMRAQVAHPPVCAADRLTLRRQVPLGTVGGRMAGTCMPSRSSWLARRSASCAWASSTAASRAQPCIEYGCGR